MASENLAEKAKEAYLDDRFEVAVDLYTQAISLEPLNSELYADRAQANIKLQNFTEAVADANKAIELEHANAKAYLRKGVACIKLEEYHTAKSALQVGASLAPEDSRFTKLIKECDEMIAEEAGEESPKQVVETAPREVVAQNSTPSNADSESLGSIAAIPKPKYRHEFYQTPEQVVVTIFAKKIPASSVVVDFNKQILSVTIEHLGEDPYHLQLRLFGKIVPEKCRYDVMSTKIEIRLEKATDVLWTSLEYNENASVVRKTNASTGNQKLAFPSSKPRKDWDKLEAEVKKQEKEEALDGDAGINKVFQDIYGNADEDARRAMMKSFVESNGTVLSMDWKDVGFRKVEGSPPDGMEVKKW